MQPQGPSFTPESGPVFQPGTSESLPDSPVQSEQQPVSSPEKLGPQGETTNQGPVLPAVSLPTPQTTPPLVQPVGDDLFGQAVMADAPMVADDVDVIEKEWVDKAKTVVNQNKHDPYNQEKEVGKLQAEYLKKRYGKIVKVDK